VGEEALKLFEAAQKVLSEIISKKLIEARGIIGFYPCNSDENDDIEVYEEDESMKLKAKFCTLR